MKAIEERLNRPLEMALPDLINEHGLSRTAELLEISKATLGYWLLKLGIETRRVALKPGEHLEIRGPE